MADQPQQGLAEPYAAQFIHFIPKMIYCKHTFASSKSRKLGELESKGGRVLLCFFAITVDRPVLLGIAQFY